VVGSGSEGILRLDTLGEVAIFFDSSPLSIEKEYQCWDVGQSGGKGVPVSDTLMKAHGAPDGEEDQKNSHFRRD